MSNKQPDEQLKLSILDFVHVYQNSNPTESLKNSTEMVQLADRLGYTRYWFTEHHNTTSQISTSPDLLSVHAASHPGRIDLGIGRASGTDGWTAWALQRSREALAANDFLEQLDHLLSFFSRDFPRTHPFSNITPPGDPS